MEDTFTFEGEEASLLATELFDINEIVKTIYGITLFEGVNLDNYYFITDNEVCRLFRGQTSMFRLLIDKREKIARKRVQPSNILYNLFNEYSELKLVMNCKEFFSFYKTYKKNINKIELNSNTYSITLYTDIPNISLKLVSNRDLELEFEQSMKKFYKYYELLTEENLINEYSMEENKDEYEKILLAATPINIYFDLDSTNISVNTNPYENSVQFIFHMSLLPKVKKTDKLTFSLFYLEDISSSTILIKVDIENGIYDNENLFLTISY